MTWDNQFKRLRASVNMRLCVNQQNSVETPNVKFGYEQIDQILEGIIREIDGLVEEQTGKTPPEIPAYDTLTFFEAVKKCKEGVEVYRIPKHRLEGYHERVMCSQMTIFVEDLQETWYCRNKKKESV